MIKQIIGLIVFALFLIFAKNAYATPDNTDSQNSQTQIEAKKIDRRAKILAAYLKQFDSPLQNHSQDFIEIADKYDVDWKLVPAIAGVESTFGKFIPGGHEVKYTSYNAWGWGASTPDVAIHFDSWKEAIDTVSKGLKENYIDKGLKDPYAMNRVYAASPTWGTKVDYFMKQIEEFSIKYEAENPTTTVSVEDELKIAAISGQVASK